MSRLQVFVPDEARPLDPSRFVRPITKTPLCVVATFTAEPLREPLEMWWQFLGLEVEFIPAPYAQLFQELLDPASAMRGNRAGANAILVRWEDLAGRCPRGDTAAQQEWGGRARKLASELCGAIEQAALTVPTLVFATSGRPDVADGGAGAITRERLAHAPGITVVLSEELDAIYPVAQWYDAASDRFGHVPFTPEYFAALATRVARWHYGATARPRKVLVVDCDNTLWGGVVGEDGPRGVVVDGPFEAFQSQLVARVEAGRLLCLCSKNEEQDVLAVFAERPEMPLKARHVTARRISWAAKSSGIRELARELDLGLDSFVFLDDNPLECAEVRAACPDVLTLQLPSDPRGIAAFVAHAWPLDVAVVTDDDRKRSRSYADNAKRAQLRREVVSFADFLDSLGLEVDLSSAEAGDLPRLSQLTLRTNQFNTTALRLSEAELAARLREGWTAIVVRAADRFGDYGTVGLALSRAVGAALRVELLLMSCRALGRGIEHRLVARLGEEALGRGLDTVEIPFAPTERNRPARVFLEDVFGVSAAAEGTTVFVKAAGDAAAVRFEPDRAGEPIAADNGSEPSTGHTPASREAAAPFQRIAEEFQTPAAVLRALAGRTRPRGSISQGFVEPRPGLEATIAGVWREVLRLDRVGARDGFGELGGRSIHLVQVHRRLLDLLEVDLDIATLFQHPTVCALATHVEGLVGPARPLAAAGRAEKMKSALASVAARRQARS